jgi:hypothetical protein
MNPGIFLIQPNGDALNSFLEVIAWSIEMVKAGYNGTPSPITSQSAQS